MDLRVLVLIADHDLGELVRAQVENLGCPCNLVESYDQAHAVRALLSSHGFTLVQSRNDLAGIARCSGGQWPLAQTVK